MWHRILARISLVAVFGMWVSAQADTYWAYTYKSFDVVADGSSSFAESLARNLERFDIAFAQVTSLDLGEWRPTTHIYALDSDAFKQVWPNPTPLESSFHTSPFATDIVMDNAGESDNRYHGAYFGYAGSLLMTDGRLSYPFWFQQGVSDLFAASNVRSSEVIIGGFSEGQVRALTRQPWIRMRTLLRMTGNDPQMRNAEVQFQFESECWLLLHMVMIEGTRRDQMTTYLGALSNGTPEEQAFTQSFQGTYEDLDKDLQAILFKGVLKTVIVKVPADKDRIVPVKLTAAQATARLAELTIRDRRNVDYGLKLAAQSLAAEPGNEYALRAEASGQLANGQFAAAYAALQALNAVATLSPDGRLDAARIYGSLAQAVEGHRADVGVDAKTLWTEGTDAYALAIAGDPENLQALYGYADVLQAQRDRDRIRAFLPAAEKAVYRHPHNSGLARSVSSMHAMLGDYDDALKFAFAWKRAAFTSSERSAADVYMTRLRTSKAQQDALAPASAPVPAPQ